MIDADGFGNPDLKKSVDNILIRDEPVNVGGIKLFAKQDQPLLTPSEGAALMFSLDLVVY